MTNPSNIKPDGGQSQDRQSPQQTGSKREVSPAGSGDERTPDKTIGQVKYADGQNTKQKQNDGGAGKPQSSPLEPEKQGGIGGP